MRPTIAYIDRVALEDNFKLIRNAVGKSVKIISVVKANAYGHGVIPVAGILEEAGTDFLAVAIIEEGIQLREAGIKKPVLLLGGIFPSQIKEIIQYGLIPVVYDFDNLRMLSKASVKAGHKIDFHLKVDTGMGRLGLSVSNSLKVLREVKSYKGLHMTGILSHFATSDGPDFDFVNHQFEKFKRVVKVTKLCGCLSHMANSAAIFLNKGFHLDAVRPGISLYGVNPFKEGENIPLKAVMTLKTHILTIKELNKGETVSYGRTYKIRRKTKVGVLPVGYGDGYHRILSNRGEVLIKGKRVPVIGIVCMDLIMVDLSGVDGVKAGDEAILIGKNGREEIKAGELAKKAGTIPYEIFTSISSRVPRRIVE